MASVRKREWESRGQQKIAWVADYFDNTGKRRLKTFRTQREAKDWLSNTQHEIKQGVHTPTRASITVSKAGELWISQAETDGLERATVAQYRQHLGYHIEPFVGKVKLSELSPGMIQEFRNQLVASGRSRIMAKKVLSSLGAMLGTAMAAGKVARNVVREQARNARRHSIDKRHKKRLEVGVDIPTKNEIRAMLAKAGGRWRPLVIAAVFTGLRASELRGLRWDDVDFDRAVLTVRQRADRYGTIGSPKSDAGKREVPLAPMVVNALREWRLACPNGAQNLVFPNNKGNVDSLPNIHRRGLGALQFAAGIVEPSADNKGSSVTRPKYGLHSLRHAAASLFIEQGFTPKRVQALMGHSSIQVTFDTYGHLFPSQEEDQIAMQQLQARLVG